MTASQVHTGQGHSAEFAKVSRAVSAIVMIVVGLTFLFGFGNVLTLALCLGVPMWVAPLVAPAVDLSVLGLLLAARQLALNGASPEDLRPARHLLTFASVVTLALNVAAPLLSAEYGKAAFDAVGPMLLIGRAEVGPGLLSALSTLTVATKCTLDDAATSSAQPAEQDGVTVARREPAAIGDDLAERARHANARNWAEHRRPISAESLRKTLNVGSARARALVRLVRDEGQGIAPAA